MDASIFEKSKEHQFLHLRAPDGELCYDGDEPVGFVLLSVESPEYKKIVSEIFSRMRKLKNPGYGVYEKAITERLSRATVEVKNLSVDGDLVESNQKAIADLYKDYSSIRRQVFDYLEDESNFLENKPSD